MATISSELNQTKQDKQVAIISSELNQTKSNKTKSNKPNETKRNRTKQVKKNTIIVGQYFNFRFLILLFNIITFMIYYVG